MHVRLQLVSLLRRFHWDQISATECFINRLLPPLPYKATYLTCKKVVAVYRHSHLRGNLFNINILLNFNILNHFKGSYPIINEFVYSFRVNAVSALTFFWVMFIGCWCYVVYFPFERALKILSWNLYRCTFVGIHMIDFW